LKLLTASLTKATDNFLEMTRGKVTREGVDGTRLIAITREDGIDFRNVIEVFTSGKTHYRIVARAPAELYKNYASTFSEMLDSVEFLPAEAQGQFGATPNPPVPATSAQ
jgi:hypothetical protein